MAEHAPPHFKKEDLMPEINVLINDDTGEITIDVQGAVGADCEKLTKELEEKLGVVTARKKLPEFFQKSITKVTQR